MSEMTLSPRVPPHSEDAEIAVLGSVLLSEDTLTGEHVSALTPAHFYARKHQLIFAAMLTLRGRGDPPDLVTLQVYLHDLGQLDEAGGLVYLMGLGDQVPTSAYAERYAMIVKEKWVQRELIRQAGELMRTVYDGGRALEDLMALAANVGANLDVNAHRGAYGIDEIMSGLVTGLSAGTGQRPVPTGFRDLDRQLGGGLVDASLTVIAARPSMGKTALSVQLAMNVAASMRPTDAPADGQAVIVSLEMPRDQLGMRLLAGEARVDSSRLKDAEAGKVQLNERDWERVAYASEKIARLPLVFLDDPVQDANVHLLANRLRRMHREKPIQFVMIDYLQLMNAGGKSGGGENRQQEISTISRMLKALARELNVPVVVLSQLSRAVEQRPNHRPMLSDLRESGAIEQDADVVMFIYRDEYYNKETDQQGVAEIIVGKQRNGPVGTVKLQYHAAHVRFNDLAGGEA